MNQSVGTFLFVSLLFACSNCLSSANDAVLRIDPKAHTGLIWNVVVAKNNDIITTSDDKTIRIFDSKTGLEKRKILGQIGSASSGKTYTIALSPDEKYLATAGYYEPASTGSVRIYHYATGKLHKLLKSHDKVTPGLAFSADGSRLLSASSDGTSNVWDVKNQFELIDTIDFHSTARVSSVATLDISNQPFAITAANDGKIALYDLNNRLTTKAYSSALEIESIAINQTLKHIAISGVPLNLRAIDRNQNYIYIFNFDLELIRKVPTNKIKSTRLAYSPNGKLLVAGVGSLPVEIAVYTASANYEHKTSFKRHDNTVAAVAFLDNNTVVSAGGMNNEIFAWNVDTNAVEMHVAGDGQSIWSVGINGDNVAWGTKPRNASISSSWTVDKATNINDIAIQDVRYKGNQEWIKGLPLTNGHYLLEDQGTSLVVRHKGIQVGVIDWKDVGNLHITYGWYKNFIVTAGANGYLKIYSQHAEKLADLTGHTGTIWSMALDGDRLVSGGADQVLKLWDLSTLEKVGDNLKLKVLDVIDGSVAEAAGLQINDVIVAVNGATFFTTAEFQSTIKHPGQYTFSIERSGKAVVLIANKSGPRFGFVHAPSTIEIKPLVNLFVSKTGEWITWTKDGLFNASPDASEYIGFHVNQGEAKEAEFVSVDKFYNTHYRPDLISKAIKGESLSQYVENINIETLIAKGLAPHVEITSPVTTSLERDLNLTLRVCEKDGGYDNLTILLNGTPVDIMGNDRGLKIKALSDNVSRCFEFEKLISLQNGQNDIGFRATDGSGQIESNLAQTSVAYDGRSKEKPNLFILGIGVDKYRDGDLWLTYSTADTNAFIDSIVDVSNGLYANTHTYKLLDAEVTKENIQAMFDKIGAETTRDDVFMLYVAGHGITDAKTGEYFYLPVDFRYRNDDSIRNTGMGQNEFKLALSKIQAMKSLVVLDTCNSGSFAEAMASRGVLQKTAINKLTRATGRATIVASSKDQVALEGYKGHGVFTYTLLEAVRGKGYGGDGQITIKELAAYIEDVLPDRTYNKWGYEQVPQSFITGNDFPIGLKQGPD